MFAKESHMVKRYEHLLEPGNIGKMKLKNRMINKFGKKLWGPRRVLPKIAPKSFRELWKERSESSQNT